MKFPVYIEDGYTQKGFIAAVPGLHDALRFSFRPMTATEQSQHSKEERKYLKEGSPGGAWVRFAADSIAKKLVSWDACKADGSPIALRGLFVASIHPALFGRLYGVISGTDASDIDPEWTEAEKEESADYQFQAVAADQSPGEVAAADREKN